MQLSEVLSSLVAKYILPALRGLPELSGMDVSLFTQLSEVLSSLVAKYILPALRGLPELSGMDVSFITVVKIRYLSLPRSLPTS